MIIEFQFGMEQVRFMVPAGQATDYLRLLKGREDSEFIMLPTENRFSYFMLPKASTAFRVTLDSDEVASWRPDAQEGGDSEFWGIVDGLK